MKTQTPSSFELTPTSLSTSQVCLLPEPCSFTTPIHSVKESKDYNFYGPVSVLFKDRLQKAVTFMRANTNDSAEDLENQGHPQSLEILTKFFKDSHDDCQTPKSACWFTVRMTKPETEFTVPRWHTDGNFYNIDFSTYEAQLSSDSPLIPAPQPRSKYATTLLGPPTLLLDIPHTPGMLAYLNDSGTDFENSWVNHEDLSYRQKTDRYFTEKEIPRIEAGLGQIVRFSWGSRYAAVHSEPDMSFGDRVFVSVLFGSHDEIRYMCGYRETRYEMEGNEE